MSKRVAAQGAWFLETDLILKPFFLFLIILLFLQIKFPGREIAFVIT